MAKKKESRQKKINVRVDFTPMVDMMMLLITFFMLCTSLAKPQTMELSMPSNDKNMDDEDRSVTKASYTVTIYVGANDKIYYVAGIPKYDDPSCLKETTWGKDGIRKVLITHVTEDGTQPVQQVMLAKAKLDEKKAADLNNSMPDSVYQKELSKIKAGNINGEKIQTMTIIIKATDKDLRFYLMEYIKKTGAICPTTLDLWKFIPEEWTVPAAKRDYKLLFKD